MLHRGIFTLCGHAPDLISIFDCYRQSYYRTYLVRFKYIESYSKKIGITIRGSRKHYKKICCEGK